MRSPADVYAWLLIVNDIGLPVLSLRHGELASSGKSIPLATQGVVASFFSAAAVKGVKLKMLTTSNALDVKSTNPTTPSNSEPLLPISLRGNTKVGDDLGTEAISKKGDGQFPLLSHALAFEHLSMPPQLQKKLGITTSCTIALFTNAWRDEQDNEGSRNSVLDFDRMKSKARGNNLSSNVAIQSGRALLFRLVHLLQRFLSVEGWWQLVGQPSKRSNRIRLTAAGPVVEFMLREWFSMARENGGSDYPVSLAIPQRVSTLLSVPVENNLHWLGEFMQNMYGFYLTNREKEFQTIPPSFAQFKKAFFQKHKGTQMYLGHSLSNGTVRVYLSPCPAPPAFTRSIQKPLETAQLPQSEQTTEKVRPNETSFSSKGLAYQIVMQNKANRSKNNNSSNVFFSSLQPITLRTGRDTVTRRISSDGLRLGMSPKSATDSPFRRPSQSNVYSPAFSPAFSPSRAFDALPMSPTLNTNPLQSPTVNSPFVGYSPEVVKHAFSAPHASTKTPLEKYLREVQSRTNSLAVAFFIGPTLIACTEQYDTTLLPQSQTDITLMLGSFMYDILCTKTRNHTLHGVDYSNLDTDDEDPSVPTTTSDSGASTSGKESMTKGIENAVNTASNSMQSNPSTETVIHTPPVRQAAPQSPVVETAYNQHLRTLVSSTSPGALAPSEASSFPPVTAQPPDAPVIRPRPAPPKKKKGFFASLGCICSNSDDYTASYETEQERRRQAELERQRLQRLRELELERARQAEQERLRREQLERERLERKRREEEAERARRKILARQAKEAKIRKLKEEEWTHGYPFMREYISLAQGESDPLYFPSYRSHSFQAHLKIKQNSESLESVRKQMFQSEEQDMHGAMDNFASSLSPSGSEESYDIYGSPKAMVESMEEPTLEEQILDAVCDVIFVPFLPSASPLFYPKTESKTKDTDSSDKGRLLNSPFMPCLAIIRSQDSAGTDVAQAKEQSTDEKLSTAENLETISTLRSLVSFTSSSSCDMSCMKKAVHVPFDVPSTIRSIYPANICLCGLKTMSRCLYDTERSMLIVGQTFSTQSSFAAPKYVGHLLQVKQREQRADSFTESPFDATSKPQFRRRLRSRSDQGLKLSARNLSTIEPSFAVLNVSEPILLAQIVSVYFSNPESIFTTTDSLHISKFGATFISSASSNVQSSHSYHVPVSHGKLPVTSSVFVKDDGIFVASASLLESSDLGVSDGTVELQNLSANGSAHTGNEHRSGRQDFNATAHSTNDGNESVISSTSYHSHSFYRHPTSQSLSYTNFSVEQHAQESLMLDIRPSVESFLSSMNNPFVSTAKKFTFPVGILMNAFAIALARHIDWLEQEGFTHQSADFTQKKELFYDRYERNWMKHASTEGGDVPIDFLPLEVIRDVLSCYEVKHNLLSDGMPIESTYYIPINKFDPDDALMAHLVNGFLDKAQGPDELIARAKTQRQFVEVSAKITVTSSLINLANSTETTGSQFMSRILNASVLSFEESVQINRLHSIGVRRLVSTAALTGWKFS